MLKEWVGNASVSMQSLVLESKVFLDGSAAGGSFTSVRVAIPVGSLAPVVREQVSKLKKNELTKVTFAAGAGDPLGFAKSSLTGITAQLKPGRSVATVSSLEDR